MIHASIFSGTGPFTVMKRDACWFWINVANAFICIKLENPKKYNQLFIAIKVLKVNSG